MILQKWICQAKDSQARVYQLSVKTKLPRIDWYVTFWQKTYRSRTSCESIVKRWIKNSQIHKESRNKRSRRHLLPSLQPKPLQKVPLKFWMQINRKPQTLTVKPMRTKMMIIRVIQWFKKMINLTLQARSDLWKVHHCLQSLLKSCGMTHFWIHRLKFKTL